ncbi:MAG: LAGLIDADG family homing endonuclease [Chloroflexota bacterium]|nr:LAGLIDADG family homing endonuclease [Chloroflexota bacterium]
MHGKPKDENAQAREADLELLAYAAGLFDGEGSVTINRILTDGPAPRHNLVASIDMTDPQGIQYLADRFEGNVRWYKRQQAEWADVYAWALSGEKALSFLQAIRPYLRVKGEQADVGIRFCKAYFVPKEVRPTSPVTVDRVAFAEECRSELLLLNATGNRPPSLKRKRRVPKGQLALPTTTRGGRPRKVQTTPVNGLKPPRLL